MTRPSIVGGADGGVRAAGRPAHDGELSDAQRVHEVRHVGRPVDEPAPALVGGEAHAGTVGGDEADAHGDGGLVRGRGVEAGTEAAVTAQDREAGRMPYSS